MTEASVLGIAILLWIGIVTSIHIAQGETQRQLKRLTLLDAKIDALLRHHGVRFDPFQDAPEGVREAIGRGEPIEAIKLYRRATGAGLKEAKDFVDELRRRSAAR